MCKKTKLCCACDTWFQYCFKHEEWSVILEPIVRFFMLLISNGCIDVYPYPSIIPPVMVCYKIKIEIQMLGTILPLEVTKTEPTK